MNKLLISISSLRDLSLLADGYILGYDKYTLFASHYFSYDEIKSVKDKNIYVLINALIHQKDLKGACQEVDKLVDLGVNFIVQDIGLIHHLLTKVNPDRIIFYPYTYICNKEELSAYHSYLHVPCYISTELTLEEIKDTLSVGHGVFNMFGYTPIYQSFRKILSLYQKQKDLTLPEEVYLKEHSREDKYPVRENKYGSVIFRSHPNSFLEDFDYIKKAEYLVVDSFNVDHDLFIKIVDLSNQLIKGEIGREDILKEYQKLSFESFEDFKYQKTVLRK